MTFEPDSHHEDVTGKPEYEAVVHPAPIAEKYLVAQGFSLLGLITHVLPVLEDGPTRIYESALDQQEWEQSLERNAASVYVSPGGHTACDPEFTHGMEWVRFRSLLADGAVVITRRPPSRLLKPANLEDDIEDGPEKELVDSLEQRNNEVNYRSHPAAGLFIETLPGLRVEQLWEAHKDHLARRCTERDAMPIDLRDMRVYLAMAERYWWVVQYRQHLVLQGYVWFILRILPAALVSPLIPYVWFVGLRWHVIIGVVGWLAVGLVVWAFTQLAWLWRIGPALVARLTLSRPRPASDLVDGPVHTVLPP